MPTTITNTFLMLYDTVLKFNAKLMSTHSINKSIQELEKITM